MIKVSIAPVAGRHRLTGFLLGVGMICLVVLGTASQAQRFFFLSEYDCVRAAGAVAIFMILLLYFERVDPDVFVPRRVKLFSSIASLLPSVVAYVIFPSFVSEWDDFTDSTGLIVVLAGFLGVVLIYASLVGLIRIGVFHFIDQEMPRRIWSRTDRREFDSVMLKLDLYERMEKSGFDALLVVDAKGAVSITVAEPSASEIEGSIAAGGSHERAQAS